METHRQSKVRQVVEKHFPHSGFAKLERPLSLDAYKSWLKEGMHGNMEFLVEHLPSKEVPKSLGDQLKTSIVVSVPYVPHPKTTDLGFGSFKNSKKVQVASYAQGEDYHYWLKAKLGSLIEELKQEFPEESYISYTDSGPVLERDLAYRAGLGWVGKNTCLIHPKRGSLFFIGEILTSLNLDESQDSIPDRCGKCTRCMDACPTGALSERKLDARKCISYLTIEHKTEVDPQLAENFNSWFYGCDICQNVCPWNEKLLGQDFAGSKESYGVRDQFDAKLSAEEKTQIMEDLKLILNSSNKALAKRFRGTPMTRANGNMHKRNAIIVAYNYQLWELSNLVEQIKVNTSSEMLQNTANWFLSKISR